MTRPARLLATLAISLAAALAISTYRPGKAKADAATGPATIVAEQAARSREPATGPNGDDDASYPLETLPVFSRAIHYVSENYVEPKRIDPKGMVVAALDMVEKTVAEVMVEGDPKLGKLTLTVGSASRQIDVSGVDSIFKVRAVMGEAVAFIQKHLVAHKNLREIEYAATNGMLSTLDPHSILLDPKMFREMKLQTRGEFGGLGFVIAMRDGNLTVVRVIKNTPAQKAGIRPKDVITRIGEQSTINMDLQDAVDRLRGKPATRVGITVLRGGSEVRKLELSREVISVETVPQAKLLAGNVGYVKLSQFSANSTRDLVGAVTQQRAQAGGQLRGLVLDLRGNPGGLLEQAISVSDLFLSQGVIVKTVGEGMRMHEVKEAHGDRDEFVQLPLVVIVNNNSASASEIVAGALKNNGRALIIGRQTFGKGSVQVLYDFSDPARPTEESALKLTIAQYLTPGDISIQEVGVAPDVLLLPGRALESAVNYFAPPRMLGEIDLDKHFANPADAQLSQTEAEKRATEHRERAEKAALELRYLLDEKEDTLAKAMKADEKREAAALARGDISATDELTPEQQEDEDAEANPDELVEDYQIRFARDLLGQAPFADRPRLLEAARGFVAERQGEEEKRLQARLTALGLDWSAGPAQGTPRPVVTVSPPPGKQLPAGEKIKWTVTVENRGDGPLRQLRGWALVEKNPLLDRREFVFGLVKPGEKRSWTVPVKVPKGLDSRHDEIRIHFEEANGRSPGDALTALDVVEVPKPLFAFSTQVEDVAGGNGDGLVQRGEHVALRVDVKNEGRGPSGEKTYVSLKNLGDEKVFIEKGRVVLGHLAPGEVKSAVMQVEVKRGLKGDTMPLRVMVVDEGTDEFVSERLELPLAADVRGRVAAAGAVKIRMADAVVRAGASPEAASIAVARKGAVLAVIGRAGDFTAVEWQKGRVGFVASADVEAARAAEVRSQRAGGPPAVEVWQREPPRIALSPDPARGAPVVVAEKLRFQGSASVPSGVPGAQTRLRDFFVFVNDQKVFFKVVPEEGGATRLDFDTEVPLKPGNNAITFFAREDEELQTRRTVYVHRRAVAQVAQGSQAEPAGQ